MKTNLAILVSVLGFASLAAAQPKGEMKKAPPKDAMAMPTPAPEIAAMGKAMAGTMSCTGKAFMPDNSAIDMTGTMSSKLDLDGFWIHDSFSATMGKGKFSFESFTTLDKTDKKWHRVMVDSVGGYMVGTSAGPAAGKVDFALEGSGPMGPMMFKDHMDTTTNKSWGERSADKGKTWIKDYEVTCKK